MSNHDTTQWVWECVTDPTRDEDWPGDFLRGRFRLCDLRFSARNHGWPEGIAFRHIKQGALLRYAQGQLLKVTYELA
jgi:hypothetical protein